ncbi:MAG: hypothetical protein LBN32_00450 [Helicobacteraceae bacterium]|jgi:hypothetical protein|nr:hypothetical protein [Helicobacteraceae bacterium]
MKKFCSMALVAITCYGGLFDRAPSLPEFQLIVKEHVVIATGTLRFPESEGTAFPYHTIRLLCIKPEGNCYESKAILEGNSLSAWIWQYQIAKWDNQTIVAVADDAACVREVWVINFAKKSVIYAKSPRKEAARNPYCEAFSEVSGALIDGATAVELERLRKK